MTSAGPPPLTIGSLVYPGMDQADFTGPFEVLARIPHARVHVAWKTTTPVRDRMGLLLTPDTTLHAAPSFDVLHVPGGHGQEDLMDDEEVLSFVRRHADAGRYVLSVCTGALICGAAGILCGRRATTHWTAFELLSLFGAIPVDSRVVVDGRLVTTAGVTAGLDGALRLATLLCGETAAQRIQLAIEYAPELPFTCGSPKTAPREVVDWVKEAASEITNRRLKTARRIAARLGIAEPRAQDIR